MRSVGKIQEAILAAMSKEDLQQELDQVDANLRALAEHTPLLAKYLEAVAKCQTTHSGTN